MMAVRRTWLGVVVAFALGVVACTAPVKATPAAPAATCSWVMTVNAPPIDARGNQCTIRQIAAPTRINVLVQLGAGHTLVVDTDDPIAGDPYGRDEPAVVVDGKYVPCGADALGTAIVDITAARWSVNIDFSHCQQAVAGKLWGTLPLMRD